MSGEAKRTQTAYISAPIDGINLIAPPNQMAPTEARQLDNYFCLDWGIRQRAGGVEQKNFGTGLPYAVTMMVPFIRLDSGHVGEESMMVCAQKKVFRLNSKTDTAPTDVTGTNIITSDYQHRVIFNDYIFLFNGVNLPGAYRISGGGGITVPAFTGPADPSKLYQPTTFKSRLYVTEYMTTKFWYAGVGAIAGPMSSFDLAQVFQRGGTIAVLTSWSFNQGIGSEEFLVAISTLGEVLVYSGDYPAATNWQLAGRTSIPSPVGSRGFIQVAQDVYVATMRGVIALSRVFSGNTDDRYFIVSNKLGPNAPFDGEHPGYSLDYPFLYFVGANGRKIYVLNYERGAWSCFRYDQTILPNTSAAQISSVAFAFGSLYIGTAVNEAKLYRFDDFQDGAVSGPDFYIWKTPFLGFDNGSVKSSKYVRVVARDLGSAPITNRVSVATDFKNTDIDSLGNPLPGNALQPDYDQQVTPNPNPPGPSIGPKPHDWVVQELRPPGNGKTLSYVFAKSGQSDMGEISGAEVMIENGSGAY